LLYETYFCGVTYMLRIILALLITAVTGYSYSQ